MQLRPAMNFPGTQIEDDVAQLVAVGPLPRGTEGIKQAREVPESRSA